MDFKLELDNLNYYLRKKKLTYNEFNEIIGNYYVKDYEEFDENYYILEIIAPLNNTNNKEKENMYYTDYIEIIK
ncbi:hypothetical protein CHF27_006245 [Romboutsia maritimum]|uniref:Uncharacterized protein n=1 Tax=Romboutsia maritimum TaxID=2020948 RepID=A0A371ITB8_9FIRM|nr:hypothetical protein [Romboutsia maritimum]RDY23724.1 hypothetical protein CHF27_006245 [Romboutsia maritimum]